MSPRHFRSRQAFRAWLHANHATVRELWVAFYKKGARRGGLSYAEAVDEALCYGWIDGIKKRVDDERFTRRFTPRTRTSSWSLANTRRVRALTKLGLMAAPGLEAFRARDRTRSGIYLYEQRNRPLAPAHRRAFQADAAAWSFFRAQPPGYQRLIVLWIMSAKKTETQARRLAGAIAASAKQTRIRWM